MKIQAKTTPQPGRASTAPKPQASATSPAAPGWAPKAQRAATLRAVAPAPRDGKAFCDGALRDIQARTARGESVRVVFDIDDTLSESRSRTLQVAKDWDSANGTHHFDGLTLAKVSSTGGETARGLGLSESVVQAFAAHWDTEFWKPERFAADTPIAPMVKLAQAARAAGAQVIFLTGRVEALEGATIAQLRRFGLQGVDAQTVVSKADLSVRTAAFKTQWLQESAAQGHHLAFFVTESRRDVAAVQQSVPQAPVVLRDSPLGGAETVAADTPVYR
jgi:phosphoglycolate phosphatase-like HAD superfamily hydrolase